MARQLEKSLNAILSKNKYNFKDQTKKDILHALVNFKELIRHDVDTFIDNSGQTKRLACLDGTIPVNYQDTTYNIPIRVWIQLNYPYQPPICYVRPTQNMSVKVSKHVDGSGLVYLPYLCEWRHPSSDLSGLIQVMCIVFGEQPPVYSYCVSDYSSAPVVQPESSPIFRPQPPPLVCYRSAVEQQQMVDKAREKPRSMFPVQLHLEQPQKNVQQFQDDKQNVQKELKKVQGDLLQLQDDMEQVATERQHLQEENRKLREEKQKLLEDNQQLLEHYHLQSDELAELRQQLSSSANEIDALKCRHSTLQRAHNSYLTQPQQLQSINIPATDVCLLGTQLGGGSYGVVFRAMWKGIQVAVKVFHEELRVSEHNKKLFRQELDNCAALRHPNIVTFCGATLENDNPLQIVTELLEGSLDDLIKAAIVCGFYLTHLEQVHLSEGTAAGITFLHQRQPTPFVHCDIRPANILVTRNMSAKVADLGGSHIIGASTSAGPLSINYIAPERIGGRGPRTPSNPSCDIYSLGVTLTELFTGKAALRSERNQQLTTIGNEELQTMCIKATSARANKRPTAAELLVKLQQLKKECNPRHVRRLVIGKVEGDVVQIVDI